MATNSILKNVTIKDKSLGNSFVRALEDASEKKGKQVTMTKSHKDLRGSAIKDVFKGM